MSDQYDSGTEQEEVAWEVHLVYSRFNESPSDECLTVAAPDRETAIEEARDTSQGNPPEVGPVYKCREIPVQHCENRTASRGESA